MGAIRIDRTNGTATFVNMDIYSQAVVANANEGETTLQCEKADGSGSDSMNIVRFNTTDPAGDGVVWPYMMKAAYIKIAVDPVEYGYPILGTLDPGSYEEYIKYDVSKIGDNVISTALSGSTSLENVWSERTALSNAITDKGQGDTLISTFESDFSDLETERDTEIKDCDSETGAGNTYNGPCGTVEPLDGGLNSEGCRECLNSYFNTQVSTLSEILGDLSWHHQYIFASEGGPS